MVECKHNSGDFIEGMWICAHCFLPLDRRPVKYGIVPGRHKGQQRQDIVWQAKIAICGGVPFRQFLGWMVRHLRLRSQFTIPRHEALSHCLEALREIGEVYGDDGCSWDKDDAKEIVNELICTYWDEGPRGSNSTSN